MKIKVLAFGIAKDIFGATEIEAIVNDDATVGELKAELDHQYPQLQKIRSYMIAVNNEYADADQPLHERDEIAVIPPVSGG